LFERAGRKNFIWKKPGFPVGEGHIHINYRNKVKTTYIADLKNPKTWVSKNGSVTFTQAGMEFPYGE
jgi:hypothetical protein